MENELTRIGSLLRSIEFDKQVLGILLPTLEAIRLNREAGLEHTARILEARRRERIAKRPRLVETEQIVLMRITATIDELQRLGVHV